MRLGWTSTQHFLLLGYNPNLGMAPPWSMPFRVSSRLRNRFNAASLLRGQGPSPPSNGTEGHQAVLPTGSTAWRCRLICGSRRGPGDARMEFVDKVLKCVDCGSDFVFTAGEQLFFHDKQFKNDPKRCKQCKAKRSAGSGPGVRAETRTVCSQCGTETTVPFKPTQGRPVLCRSCFQQARPPVASAQSPATGTV